MYNGFWYKAQKVCFITSDQTYFLEAKLTLIIHMEILKRFDEVMFGAFRNSSSILCLPAGYMWFNF